MPAPFFSVILVCRNPGPKLAAALASVWAQRDASCEIIVIDGASTDGTREWLQAQRERLATMYSEPDGGVYDAMNRGLAAAIGDWVLFLGADDRLVADTVLRDAQARLRTASAGVAAGEAVYDDGRRYRLGAPGAAIRRNFVHHQGAFYRRVLFDRFGPFDAGLAVMADYDLNLRLLHGGVPFLPLDLRVAVCGSGGLSDAGQWAGYREEIAVRHRHFPFWRCGLWDLGSLVRYARKKILRSPASTRPE